LLYIPTWQDTPYVTVLLYIPTWQDTPYVTVLLYIPTWQDTPNERMSGLLNCLKPVSNLSIITGTARAALWPSLWQSLANYRQFSEREETKKEYFFLSLSLFDFFSIVALFLSSVKTNSIKYTYCGCIFG